MSQTDPKDVKKIARLGPGAGPRWSGGIVLKHSDCSVQCTLIFTERKRVLLHSPSTKLKFIRFSNFEKIRGTRPTDGQTDRVQRLMRPCI